MDKTGVSVETEKKYRLTGPLRERIIADLESSGAKFEGREFEENTIFSGEALRAAGGVVRIRKTGARSLLTFKRRIRNDLPVKQQTEFETEVADAAAAEAIIRELGLSPSLIYEKHRDTWRFRQVELVLDELPFGLFMEIEGSITAIAEAEMLLGLEDLEVEHETYPRLTARLGEDLNGVIEARF